jgi:phage host-nuclease inhibitor protein Gam
MLLLLLAQVATTPSEILGGTAGWTTSGLLAMVLYWLAFHYLPAKDKFIKELIEAHAKQMGEMMVTNGERSKADRADFQNALDRVTTHCEKELSTITAGMVEQLRAVRIAVNETAEEGREMHQMSRDAVDKLAAAVGIKMATGEIKLRTPPPAKQKND